MKKGMAILWIAFAVVAVGLIFQAALHRTAAPVVSASGSSHQQMQVTFNDKPLTLEIVTSTADVEEGLGDRDSMPLDHGMLFVFDHSAVYPFWMRHMHFSLDIIWLSGGQIVDIAYHLPPPAGSEIPVTYTPKVAADEVIEVNAGQAAAYGLTVGSVVSLK